MRSRFLWFLCLAFAQWSTPISAIEIVVDYSYDTLNFFDTNEKREAIEAAAARYSRVISSELSAVGPEVDIPCGDTTCSVPWRVGFAHPGTGETIELSTAANATDDPISVPAYEYNFPGLAEDEWILFVGGRELASTGLGGTSTGRNFTGVLDKLDGPMHRNVIANTPEDTAGDIPAWGGSVTFSTDVNWHFALDSSPPFGNQSIDFYSIALHEIGHVLGLGTVWNQWSRYVVEDSFFGPAAVEAFNESNDPDVTSLQLVDNFNPHWKDDAQQSPIFAPGEPNLVGTVQYEKQELLLDPTFEFSQDIRRFELTRVDAAALTDLGWSIIDSLDWNNDSVVNGQDVDLACSAGLGLGDYYEELNSLQGDIDFDGAIQFSDFLVLSNNFGSNGNYSDGDLTCDGAINFADFLLMSDGFGDRASAVSSVPEPTGMSAWSIFTLLVLLRRRSRLYVST